ncbi:retropepsin-like domain-containing protein [Mucilaginibacter mali]|uniref:Retropepsin-like domain-containing protein n=1 Tax=Mucilaginibacter mali TaxID=2740462 RepID=A0A7D4TNT5_9SPHI|nr:retropepsin-like aspartic protease [Mucilaginibacter mali]QKJ30174.1 retropepsin-like domain-containing protein [Mucilaginibacter mali]
MAYTKITSRCASILLLCLALGIPALAQKKIPVIRSTTRHSTIYDGMIKMPWDLDPKVKTDVYYVNVPRRPGKVTLATDQGQVSFKTKFGNDYDLIVLINDKDSCHVRISAKDDPATRALSPGGSFPDTISFTLKGSRIYLPGILNGKDTVSIQFDTGANAACVSKASSERLKLVFGGKTILSNSQGVNEVRKSVNNKLTVGRLHFNSMSFVETGNMQPGEDLIIGYNLLRHKIIEIDYDKHLFIVHDKLPVNAKSFVKQPLVNRLSLKTNIVQNGKKYIFWVGMDTGRDGTMLIGQEFTEQPGVWENLKELTMINGRKIIRLDATIAGVTFKDIVTNAADPTKPAARRTGTYFGNVILNHFNWIIDNVNGCIYLKPNSRINEPYSNYSSYESEMKKLNQ